MTTRNIIAIVAIIAIIVLGFVAYSIFRTPEEASAPIEAIPIAEEQQDVPDPTATPVPPTPIPPTPTSVLPAEPEVSEKPGASPDDSPLAEPSADAASSPLPTPLPDEEPAEADTSGESEPVTASAGPVIFEIIQDESEARFIIEEVLRGEDKTVVGVTDQVAGEIAIDAANPTNSQIGTILVNARTLETDSNFRNRAIKNQILRTDNFEFVTFEPTEIRGLPEQVTVAEPVSFQIAGNLTVTDVTNEVVFDVTVTPISNERIEGLATVTILYRDFGLFIPDAQAVDTVEDEVILQLEFVAIPRS